jgi:CubicO group peptidase (beta-lactamase class C family)
MTTRILLLTLFLTIPARAHLPMGSAEAAGFDPARLEVMYAATRRFVEDGRYAGIITLLARDGKVVDLQTYGYRDLEKRLPMEPDTICRIYSMSKIVTTYCQIDVKERIVAIAMAQHFPFNDHGFFARFQTGYYQALK